MLMELLSKASTVAMLSFVVSSMLAMGAGLTVSQIFEPLRNARLVMLALLANFVLMPLGALALAKVLWLDDPFAVGLLVLGCAAGAPFLPKLAELAKGNLAFSVGAMVLLMVVTVGYLPVVMPLLLPGVTVDPWNIARSLIFLMLLPLAAGLQLQIDAGIVASFILAHIRHLEIYFRNARQHRLDLPHLAVGVFEAGAHRRVQPQRNEALIGIGEQFRADQREDGEAATTAEVDDLVSKAEKAGGAIDHVADRAATLGDVEDQALGGGGRLRGGSSDRGSEFVAAGAVGWAILA